jgi:hypothetical protein
MNKPEPPTPVYDRFLQLSDEERLLRALEIHQKLSAKRSRYFTWQVIRTCVRLKKPFPDWVTDYLGQCAERMCAERFQSKRAGDVRERFQWIFEFPKNKPGPGGLFDQDSSLLKEVEKFTFAVNFALRLHLGADPVEARGNAGSEIWPDADDRTLQRYLREQFRLKKLPRTFDEWMPVIDIRNLLPMIEKLSDDFR